MAAKRTGSYTSAAPHLKPMQAMPDGLFWSAPREQKSDFTPADPLAFDYLAQQVGNWLLPGLTTRTSRAQYYAVVIYGLHLAEQAVRKYGYPGDDQTRTRLFERWERFWALATLEFRGGNLPDGDQDAMRGVRGARTAWKPPAQGSLPIDYQLISRQNELGGLGAYLSSLRHYNLVSPGSLRLSPIARAICDRFWCEPDKRDWSPRYEEYALKALDMKSKKILRDCGHLTLDGLGKRSCLSSLVSRGRIQQQQRLWECLFANAPDNSTRVLVEQTLSAQAAEITDPESLLEGLCSNAWGALPAEVGAVTEVALVFGRVSRIVLERFNRAYGYVTTHGWTAEFSDVAEASFPNNEASELRMACSELIETKDVWRFTRLSYHGNKFICLLRNLRTSNPADSLRHLLLFHHSVQRSRRGGGAWLVEQGDKLILQVTSYNGYEYDPAFPPFKFDVVLQLLRDLGKIK